MVVKSYSKPPPHSKSSTGSSSIGDREDFYDRLSRTDTYASRRLKERKLKPNDTGRPLFNIEIEPQDSLDGHGIKSVRSSSSMNTNSTSSSSTSRASGRFCQRSGSSGRSGSSRQSVFDRLSNTGTKSSLRKHKKSATYVEEEDTVGECMNKLYCQANQNSRGTSQYFDRNKGPRIISFHPNQQEAEI